MTFHHRYAVLVLWSVVGVCLFSGLAPGQQCVTTAPPSDAIVLFNGKDVSNWVRRNGKPAEWKVEAPAMVATNNDVLTRRNFGDYQLHLEFWIPPKPTPDTQGNGNSGVYLYGFYEIQIIDSAGRKPHPTESCGAVYHQAPPLVDASLPAGQWQSFDILFQAPVFDRTGKLTSKARVTILQNGICIQHDLPMDPTPGSLPLSKFSDKGPVLLQYHGYPVKYRNIWLRPLPRAQPAPSAMRVVPQGGVPLGPLRMPAREFAVGTTNHIYEP